MYYLLRLWYYNTLNDLCRVRVDIKVDIGFPGFGLVVKCAAATVTPFYASSCAVFHGESFQCVLDLALVKRPQIFKSMVECRVRKFHKYVGQTEGFRECALTSLRYQLKLELASRGHKCLLRLELKRTGD